VPLPDAADGSRSDVNPPEKELLADPEASLGRVLQAVVEEDLFKFLGEPAGVGIAGTPDFIQEGLGAHGLEVPSDLVELLAGIPHDLAGLGDVVEVGSEFQERELPAGSFLRYSGVGGHSVLPW